MAARAGRQSARSGSLRFQVRQTMGLRRRDRRWPEVGAFLRRSVPGPIPLHRRPAGVHGGVRRPFVGSVAVIVGVIGNNDATVNWRTWGRCSTRAGADNHSFDHRANDWSGDSAKLSDAQAREDAFWSQTLLAANLPGGRAPTGAVYANGYTDYNRCDALADCGIRIATRVGGASPRDVLSPQVKWMDFPRSYLDENVWVNEWNKARPMADFPVTTRRVRWPTAW